MREKHKFKDPTKKKSTIIHPYYLCNLLELSKPNILSEFKKKHGKPNDIITNEVSESLELIAIFQMKLYTQIPNVEDSFGNPFRDFI